MASHAQRCLKRLGIDDLFLGIIDCKACNLATKHSPEAFECAMSVAGVPKEEGSRCLFFDDSVKNLKTAKVLSNFIFFSIEAIECRPMNLPLFFLSTTFLCCVHCTTFARSPFYSHDPRLSVLACLIASFYAHLIQLNMGWTTVLVGLTGRDDGQRIVCPEADYEVAKVKLIDGNIYPLS